MAPIHFVRYKSLALKSKNGKSHHWSLISDHSSFQSRHHCKEFPHLSHQRNGCNTTICVFGFTPSSPPSPSPPSPSLSTSSSATALDCACVWIRRYIYCRPGDRPLVSAFFHSLYWWSSVFSPSPSPSFCAVIGQKYESCWCEEMANIGEIISDQYWEEDSPTKIIVGRFCENKKY